MANLQIKAQTASLKVDVAEDPSSPLTALKELIGEQALQRIANTEPDLLVAAIEACPINITIADMSKPDMPLAYVNPAFTATTGYSAADVIGKNCRFLQGPDTDVDAIQALRDGIANESSVAVEMVNYRKDGTPFINALKMAPVHDAEGKLISFVGIQNDVSLERARESREIGRQRREALGEMAGSVAHQINNLLQPIVTLVSLHKDDLPNEEMVSDFNLVLESARQAGDVVQDVLAFSRTSTKKLTPLPVAINVRNNIAFIETLLPVDIAVNVNVSADSEACMAMLNSTQFSQAMANLMINASQAMGGAGEIEVSLTRQEPNNICLSVRDNGPGIPEHLRSKVLEPFFTTRIDEGGTGLGLSFVYGFIKGIGGKIHIAGVPDGQLGTGCNINLYIPIANSVDPKTN